MSTDIGRPPAEPTAADRETAATAIAGLVDHAECERFTADQNTVCGRDEQEQSDREANEVIEAATTAVAQAIADARAAALAPVLALADKYERRGAVRDFGLSLNEAALDIRAACAADTEGPRT